MKNENRTTLYDLMDLDNELFKRNNKFGTYKNLFGDQIDPKKVVHREKTGKRIAIFIVKRFWHYVLIDLIKNNIEFVFPFKVLYLSIRARKFSSKVYRYKIESDGFDFIPYCLIGKHKINIIRRLLKLKLNDKYQKLLDKEIRSGHRYEMAPDKYYNDE